MEAIAPLDATRDEAVAKLYTREAPRGVCAELWRHSYGCRAWLRVERDTATHAIVAVALIGEAS